MSNQNHLYYLLLRTAEAETQCWNNLKQEIKKQIVPIIELTRGRKISVRGMGDKEKLKSESEDKYKNFGVYNFYGSHLDSIKSIAKDNTCFIDITPEDTLMCGELYALRKHDNNYENWINFLKEEFKEQNNICPVLQITDNQLDEVVYKKTLQTQFKELSKKYNNIGYRVSIVTDTYFLIDLSILFNDINTHLQSGKQFTLILDHEDLRPKTATIHAKETSPIVNEIFTKLRNINIVILSNFFPKALNESGEEINIEEIELFKAILLELKNDNKKNLLYGDYGSINSIRNDEALITRGWIPHIDIPTGDKITFYKQKVERDSNGRQMRPYKHYYNLLAKHIVEQPDFKQITESWAKEQIKEASVNADRVYSSLPRFWIAVRSQLYINNIINKLDEIYQPK